MIQVNYNSKITSMLLLRLIPTCPFCSYSVLRAVFHYIKAFLLSFSLFPYYAHSHRTDCYFSRIVCYAWRCPDNPFTVLVAIPSRMLSLYNLLGAIIGFALKGWKCNMSQLRCLWECLDFCNGISEESWLKKKGRFRHFATAFLEANVQISAPNTEDLMEQKIGNCSDQEMNLKEF